MTTTDPTPKTGRKPWTQPALTRLRSADAEIGTRQTVADGGGTFAS